MKSMYLYDASYLLGDHTLDKMAHIRLTVIVTVFKPMCNYTLAEEFKRSEKVSSPTFSIFHALQANVLP